MLPVPLDLTPGTVVAERYRLERMLGEGGMGSVWRASHSVTKKSVALKFVKGAADKPEHKRRFFREARAASVVRHPNVRQVFDVVEMEDGSPLMIMEYLEGESLAERLSIAGKMTLRELAAILVPVISAVGTAHGLGIVHRDLKPQNVFLCDGADRSVRVLDFGIAKLTALEGDAAETAALTATGSLLGTPGYMSPEQVFGEKDIDHRADVWALGLIIYQALSGTLPTQADNVGQVLKIILTKPIRPLVEVAAEVPTDVSELVARMTARNRRQRPADLREVLAVLEKHTDARAPRFGAPRSGSPDTDSGKHHAPSDADKTAEVPSEDFDTTQGKSLPTGPTTADRRRLGRSMALAIAAVAALGGAVWLSGFGRASPPQPAATASSDAVVHAPTAAPQLLVEPTVTPTVPAASSVPAGDTSSPRPSADARKPRATASATTKVAAAPPSAAPTAAPGPPAAEPTAQKGKVIEKPPF